MPHQFDTWESYFYPETYNPEDRQGTLRNLFGERDSVALSHREYARTAERQRELLSGVVEIPRTYDLAHARAIHRHLFQDVYEWAGEIRSVNIVKHSPFATPHTGAIERFMQTVNRQTNEVDWNAVTRSQFAQNAGEIFTNLNQAHPFREGNGRTSKIFMHHIAEQSPFALDFTRVSPSIWNAMSQNTRPGPDQSLKPLDPQPMVLVFQQVSVPRASPAHIEADSTKAGVSVETPETPNHNRKRIADEADKLRAEQHDEKQNYRPSSPRPRPDDGTRYKL